MQNLYNILLNTFKSLALLIIIFSLPQLAKASHINGADMEYEWVGKDSFLVRVTIYKNCDQSSLKAESIFAKADCGEGNINVGGQFMSTIDITPFCKSACNLCKDNNCSLGFGIQKVVEETIADVSQINCCKFTFSYRQCCRSPLITTGAANQDLYMEVMVDRCVSGMHNSPKFDTEPITILQVNQCISRVQSASANKDDSLVYKLVQPMSAAGTDLPYFDGYTKEMPFKFAGKKDDDFTSPKCNGFHFDNQTGELNFKPTLQEVSVLAIEVEQWHKDSLGTYRKIGTTRRETTVSIADFGDNRLPLVTDDIGESKTFYVCAGNILDFNIFSFDADNDSVKMDIKTEINDALITEKPGKFPAINFNWKTTQKAVRTAPYILIINATDGACPLPAVIQNIYKIYVLNGEVPNVKISKNKLDCNTYLFKAHADSSAYMAEYKWFINGALASKDSVLQKKFFTKGKQNIKLIAKLGCENYFTDSVFIENIIGIQNTQSPQICAGDTVTKMAVGGQKYNWSSTEKIIGSSNSATVKISPLKPAWYFVEITDTILHCTKKDSVFVNVSQDCVWPGDVNKDGIVDFKDILEIGVGYNTKSAPRADTTTSWKAINTNIWKQFTAAGINYKHLDCNGDGEINALDTLVIVRNFGKTRPSDFQAPVESNSTNKMYFEFTKDTFYAGEKVEANLHLGNDVFPVKNTYGLAYSYMYVAPKMLSGSAEFIPVCDVFCQDNVLVLTNMRQNFTTKTGEIAQVRTDFKNISANGKLATFSYILEDSTHNYPTNGEWIYLKLLQTKLIDNQGKEYALKAVNDSAFVLRSKVKQVGIEQTESISEQIHIYPNPANTSVTIETGNYIFSEINIVNILGEIVVSIKQNATKANVNTSNLQPGIYFIRIKFQDQYIQHKLIITR